MVDGPVGVPGPGEHAAPAGGGIARGPDGVVIAGEARLVLVGGGEGAGELGGDGGESAGVGHGLHQRGDAVHGHGVIRDRRRFLDQDHRQGGDGVIAADLVGIRSGIDDEAAGEGPGLGGGRQGEGPIVNALIEADVGGLVGDDVVETDGGAVGEGHGGGAGGGGGGRGGAGGGGRGGVD